MNHNKWDVGVYICLVLVVGVMMYGLVQVMQALPRASGVECNNCIIVCQKMFSSNDSKDFLSVNYEVRSCLESCVSICKR